MQGATLVRHPRPVSEDGPIDVRLLDPAAARDALLVDRLAGLIGPRLRGRRERPVARRARATTAAELAELIEAREIALATRGGELAGTVHIHDVADDTSEFAMLRRRP